MDALATGERDRMTDIPHRPDPRFPNRPDHPDFWAMSDIVRENDEVWSSRYKERVAQYVDRESLRYIAWNRAGSVPGADPQMQALIASGIMDGFMLGCAYMERPRSLTVTGDFAPDGEHRTAPS